MDKELKDISWLVNEPTYRKDPALSYSTIAKYEREGVEHLFDHISTPSLLFGSAVDCLITDGEEAFENQYIIGNFYSVPPKQVPILKEVFNTYSDSYTDLNDIPNDKLSEIIEKFNYQPNWKKETKVNALRKSQMYYQTLYIAKGKSILAQNMYNKIFACYRALKDSNQTKIYFCDDNPFDNIKRYYQLKFKATLNGVDYRCMADEIIVDYNNKIIIPIDLKTSSHLEEDFPTSFNQWRYDIQAKLYYRIIRDNLDRDSYFKDFKLEDYRFIVVNTHKAPNPLVWKCNITQIKGDIKQDNLIIRDPENIGKELKGYLDNPKNTPIRKYSDNCVEFNKPFIELNN